MKLFTTTCDKCGGGTGMEYPCGCAKRAHEDVLIQRALEIVRDRLLGYKGTTFSLSAKLSMLELAVLSCGHLEHEEFKCMFFNANHGLISYRTMAIGTLSECPTYPREFLKAALHANASYVVLVHNHPNGQANASNADITMTHHLQECFQLVDIELVDHIVVAGSETYSLRNHGDMLPEVLT